MTNLSNAPMEPAAVQKCKAKWVTPMMTRLGASDAQQTFGGGDDGYAAGIGVS